jgi:Outer membrane receptor for ferrienterochelin and colicins
VVVFAQQGTLLSTAYKPGFSKGTIGAYLEDIKAKTKVEVSYSHATIDPAQHVSLNGNERTVSEVLNTILSGYGVSVIERRDKVLIVSPQQGLKKKYSEVGFHTINGYIKDSASKEVLIGAVLYVPSSGAGVVANAYGYYSLTLPAGRHKIVCSYIGYRADSFVLQVNADNRKDILLSPRNYLSEVVVTKTANMQPGHVKLSLSDINAHPALLGENDVMRALQNVSGAQCGMDGTSSLLVRGGDPGQNLSLLDGVPVYYVDHFFGLTSIFNAEAIKTVDFYKGAFPARYGGRLSSIIDVNTKDGDMEKMHGQFTMGLVKSTLNLEGPIVKNKASFMVAGRRTWLDALWRPFTKDLSLHFYDVNVKANYIYNSDNRFYASFYNGRDKMALKAQGTDGSLSWGNTVSAVKWNRIINPKLFVNTIATYSQFKFQLREKREVEDASANSTLDYSGNSTISDAALKIQAQWYPSAQHSIQAGIGYSNSKFVPVEREDSYNLGIGFSSASFYSNEITLFAEDEIKVTEKWLLRPGLHWANWISTDYNYSSLQPRIYVAFKLKPEHTIYGSYTQMSQFLHSISSSAMSFQSDFWLPSTSRVKPEEAVMGSLGYMANLKRNFSYNVEVYYKDVQNLTMYNPGKNIFDNTLNWDEKILQGIGWGYGIEFNMQKKLGKFYTSAAYTLSWSNRKFDLLNDGKAFPYRYDRRHNLKLALTYKPSKKFSATANWTYMSGEAITIPDQVFADLDNNLVADGNSLYGNNVYSYSYSTINGYRLPPIHRLDVGVDRTKYRKRSERTWSLGVFNAYAQRNVLFVEIVPVSQGELTLKGRSFFQFIPYISYKLRF